MPGRQKFLLKFRTKLHIKLLSIYVFFSEFQQLLNSILGLFGGQARERCKIVQSQIK